MITKQEFWDLNDGKGTVVLRNHYDCSAALELAAEVNKGGGPMMGKRSDDCEVLGFIPYEEWLYDMYLIAARSAQRRGDMGKYTEYIKKYFSNKNKFATPHRRIYWQGSSAVILK